MFSRKKLIICVLALVALSLIAVPAEAGKKNAIEEITGGFDWTSLYPSNIWAKMHEVPVLGWFCYKIDAAATFIYNTFIRPMGSFAESSRLVNNMAGLFLCILGCLTSLNVVFLVINGVKDYFDNYIEAPQKIPFTNWNFPFHKSIGRFVKWFKDLKLLFFVPLSSENPPLTIESLRSQLVTGMALALYMYICSFMISELTGTAAEVSMDNLTKIGAMGVVAGVLLYFKS